MPKALRFYGWPLLVGVLLALLIIQRYPQWVGLPEQDINLRQAASSALSQQGPVSYANAVSNAAPAVANLYTTKLVEDHKFLFVRYSQRWMEKVLTQYDCIVGSTQLGNSSAIKWIEWLGGKYSQPDGKLLNFQIRKSDGPRLARA